MPGKPSRQTAAVTRPKSLFSIAFATFTLFAGAALLLALSPSQALADPAASASPAPEPTAPPKPTEAELLWKRGHSAFDAGRWQDAIAELERLVSRYPADPHALESYSRIGVAYLQLSRPKDAIPPLRHFAEARSRGQETARARLDLGRAYELDRRHEEALLSAEEVLGLHDPKPKAEERVEALLLKARSQSGLGHDDRAELTLASARRELAAMASPPAPLQAGVVESEHSLKLRACSRFPSAKALAEDTARDQLNRRGVCLREAAVLVRQALEAGDVHVAKGVSSANRGAWVAYREASAHPPDPIGKRSSLELKRYREELSQALLLDWKRNHDETLSLFNAWKEAFPGEMLSLLKESLP